MEKLSFVAACTVIFLLFWGVKQLLNFLIGKFDNDDLYNELVESLMYVYMNFEEIFENDKNK